MPLLIARFPFIHAKRDTLIGCLFSHNHICLSGNKKTGNVHITSRLTCEFHGFLPCGNAVMIMGNRTFPERSDVDGCICLSGNKKTGNVLLSQAASRQVSSALRSLTSVFEMGTGVSSLLLSPDLFVF